MMKYFKLSIVLTALLAQGCGMHFSKPELDHSAQIALYQEPEKGVPALEFNKGVIDDFSGELYSWWGSDGITLSRKADTFKIAINNVGSMYVPFGREISSLDFTKNNAIRVRMRTEGKISPTIRIDIKDNLGRTTNSSAVQSKVAVGQDYKDFYFNYKDKWKQGWPDNQVVDPTLVSAIMIFVNPGMSDWTGTVYIDEIVAVDAELIPKKVGSAGGMIDNFDEDPSSSWWTGSSKLAMEKVADKDICKISSEGAGANYETFGRTVDQLDFTKAPVIRIRARVENADGFENPKLRVDIKDKDGRTANEFDMRNTIVAGTEFKDYFYDFTGKYSQAWPDKQAVNPKEIEAITLFINAGGPAYNGALYIEEIEVITLEKYNQMKK